MRVEWSKAAAADNVDDAARCKGELLTMASDSRRIFPQDFLSFTFGIDADSRFASVRETINKRFRYFRKQNVAAGRTRNLA